MNFHKFSVTRKEQHLDTVIYIAVIERRVQLKRNLDLNISLLYRITTWIGHKFRNVDRLLPKKYKMTITLVFDCVFVTLLWHYDVMHVHTDVGVCIG